MQIFAHRGSKGTHPENTLLAFEEAVRLKSDGIELDVHLSKDNQLIVIHDETIDRTTDGTGLVKELTLCEIKEVNAGPQYKNGEVFVPVPTLNEVFDLLETLKFPGIVNIEIKTDTINYLGIEKKVSDLSHSKKWTFQIVYSSFNIDTLIEMSHIDSDHFIYWIMEGSKEQLEKAESFSFIHGIHPSIDYLKNSVDDWKEFKKIIRPWTVNDCSDFQFCLTHDVKGLHTDYPEKAIQFFNQY